MPPRQREPVQLGLFGAAPEVAKAAPSPAEPVDLLLELRGETVLAIAVTTPGAAFSDKVWLPKSRVSFTMRGGAAVMVTMPQSLAIEKGLV
ncbi:hypothetical protein [Blastochloris tepida]|uniref:Uncharacterized protein n=1 Tax=Blastochloris tepida TaxID=2233851 RepID=A0A348G1C3_9HYPH|nr:hypothetical protein [Blastochloris tepida]BBF93356.1 hypothetical protein BLTE_20410 [Blastochloris tepida]